MAEKILDNLLSFKIPPQELLGWLTADNFNDVQWTNFNKNCPREDFIAFFLNYLRDQFTSILQTSNPSKPTPAKKILGQSRTIKITESSNADNQKRQIENNIPTVQQNLNSKENNSKSVENNNADSNTCRSTTITPVRNDRIEASKSIEIFSSSNLNLHSSVSSPQTSTPVIKKKNSPYIKRVELFSCSPSQGRAINPAFKESIEYEQIDNSMGRNISFDNNSFPSLGGNISSGMNDSNVSGSNTNRSEPSDLYNSNISQKSNLSTSNRIIQSPISSLYSNSLSTCSPINMKVSHNRYNNSQSNSIFQQNNSTPERSSNNMHKNSKTTPRHNFSLGDFIVTESRSSKKSNGKKNNKSLKNVERKDDDQNSIMSDASSTRSEQNTRRRKVNPTKLDVTDEKATKENTAFGVISRPFTQNPQFVNVPPIEKSDDNASFEVERGLIKIERQKMPETVSNNTNTTSNENQPKWKILPRTPSKAIQTGPIIIPSKVLVKNVDILNILAELYSGFLDHNLVFNPMTELYFIIHLVTVQYTNNMKQSSSTIDKTNEIIHNTQLDDTNDTKKNFSLLRKSLNFDDLEQSDVENVQCSGENNVHSNKSSDDLGCLNLVDGTKENLNQINKKLQQISVNENSDEETNKVKKEKNDKQLNITRNSIKTYLETPHNCVYFSTQVLHHQKAFLKCLDRVTLKLLCENNQIATFKPELCEYLDEIYTFKVNEYNKIKPSLSIGTVDLNVCFQIETDNREKFPSSIAFTCFRKQRDIFYEILKIWEDNHLVPGWTFQIALSGKIKTMLMLHVDVTNFTHLARLFKSQMLISCIQSGEQEDSLDDETMNFLKNLKDINPEKLMQLRKKLVTPLSQNGPVPLPSFPGIQEFFKDFILYSSLPMFYTYLENTFIHEIMELNNSQFVGSDIEERETEVDERTKQNFVVCLSSLRLLAKFMGFMISLPYRSETSMLEDVIKSQVSLRSQSLPSIDLQDCLQNAVIEGKLSLAVPWIVEYLAMMDHASLRLPYYKKVLEMLYCIYRASNYHDTLESEELMSQKTAVLIKLVIGWLFELPIFPTELLYSWQSKYSYKALKMICDSQPTAKIVCGLADAETSIVSVKHSLFLDKLEMVDDRILYSCCPFLKELNILLTPGNSNVNSSSSYRHVTPVTSQLQKPTKKANTKHLEIQLEEAFFHGQPMSTRKTVDYVSERVASSCVKYIYNNLLAVERQKNSESLRKIVEENYCEVVEKNPGLVKNALLEEMNILSARASKNMKEKSEQVIPKICESRVSQSIESLLAEDCLVPVKNMCAKIAIRMAMERIDQWIQSHIVGGSIFIKDMELELKNFKTNEEIVEDKKFHNSNTASPADVMDDLRKIIWDLLETHGKSTTIDNLSNLCDRMYLSLTERSDLKMIPEQIIFSLSVDLCLFIITYKEDLLTTEIQNKLFKVFKLINLKFPEPFKSPLSRILSPRNIIIMAQPVKDSVWLNCGRFLKKLLKENILSIDTLNDQAVALFRQEWPIHISKNLSTLLKEAIDGFTSTNEETERVRYLLGWVAGAQADMDQESFNFSFG